MNNSISELYLDFANQDFTNDLIRFFKTYPGSNLKVLYYCNLKHRVNQSCCSKKSQSKRTFDRLVEIFILVLNS